MNGILEKCAPAAAIALRLALGWHLAYLGIWALLTDPSFSWIGRFRCARWIFGDFFRAWANSGAMGVTDFALAWGLLAAGILLVIGRGVRTAAVFGIAYCVLIYVLDPPHFGHTGESHFLYIDRNVIEVLLLAAVAFPAKACKKSEVAQ